MKRSLFVIMVIAVISISAQAKYSGGSGASGDPYQIANATDLLAMGANTGDYGANFVLTADIDLGGYTFMAAVIAPDTDNSTLAFDGPKFTGFFNGQGHKISNLHIRGEGFYYIGLFGGTGSGCLIYNLRVENVSLYGAHYVGGLVGTNFTGAMIADCSTSGHIIGGDESSHFGGLVGMNDGNIHECFSTVDISAGDSSSDLGGLVGLISSNTILLNSYATGPVTTGKRSAFIGGLVGECYYAAVFGECYSAGTVTADSNSTNLGGLVGLNTSTDISHSYFLSNTGPTNGSGAPLSDTQMKKKNSFVNWHFDTTWQILSGDYPILQWQYYWGIPYATISKCAVTAGSKGDSISFSGIMNAETDDLDSASFIEVQISPEDMNYSSVITFPVNGTTWKNSKFSYSGTENGIKKSFSYVAATGKFAFAASNIDLSGLECPLTIDINAHDFAGTTEVDETIVNGAKPMPINLLMGVKNSLRVDKSKFTKKSGVITQIAVSGGFSVANLNDANLVTNPLDVNVGSQKFTIPSHNFKNAKGKFTCSKVSLDDISSNLIGIAAATFDFNKCTFTLTIKNTNFAAIPGINDFEIGFASFSGSDEVTLP